MPIADYIKNADFKTEKHVPVIEVINKEGEYTTVSVTVGKEVPHPNTTEHFINYIELYFQQDNKAIHRLGKASFESHGESIEGPNKGNVYTEPSSSFRVKLIGNGKLIAISYCNIHGLWESELTI